MLVRFLSFAASVLGSARHRAILVSCLTVVFAFSSVLGITLFHKGPSSSGANARGSSSSEGTETPIWLGGQRVDDKDTVPQNPKNEPGTETAASQTDEEAQAEETAAVSTPEVNLSTDSVTLTNGKAEVEIQHTGADATLTATVFIGDSETGDLTVTTEKTASGFKLHITAAETAQNNTHYKLNLRLELTANDGTTVKVIKTITVNLPTQQL